MKNLKSLGCSCRDVDTICFVCMCVCVSVHIKQQIQQWHVGAPNWGRALFHQVSINPQHVYLHRIGCQQTHAFTWSRCCMDCFWCCRCVGRFLFQIITPAKNFRIGLAFSSHSMVQSCASEPSWQRSFLSMPPKQVDISRSCSMCSWGPAPYLRNHARIK